MEFTYSIYESIDWSNSIKVNLNIDGWKDLDVEYVEFSQYLLWRIVGTTKIFNILYSTVISKHSKIEQHFKLVLDCLRVDILEWKNNNFCEEWMKIYKDEFLQLLN